MRRVACVPMLCLLLLEGCMARNVIYPPVPPLQAEEVPLPPVSSVEVVWKPGHFDWNGSDYIWISGEWVDRAGHGAMWQDGYWDGAGPAAVWIPGNWM